MGQKFGQYAVPGRGVSAGGNSLGHRAALRGSFHPAKGGLNLGENPQESRVAVMPGAQRFSLFCGLWLRVGILALFLATPLSAQTIQFDEKVESLSPDERMRITRVIQKALDYHANHFELPDTITLKLLLFANRQDYLEHQYQHSNLRGNFAGFYSPSRQEIASYRDTFQWLQTVIHEAAHHLMFLGFPQCPIWLNEGMAEFISTGYVRGSRIVFRPRKGWLRDVGKWRRLGQLPNLDDFFATSHEEFNHMSVRTQGSRSYAIAYALVFFLMSTPENRTVLSDALREARKGDGTIEAALENHYPGGLSRLEYDWYRFLRLPKSDIVF